MIIRNYLENSIIKTKRALGIYVRQRSLSDGSVNPLQSRGNYSATSNNMRLVHWPLMGGLLHLVQRGGDWVGPQPT